jgi:2-keto-3-deoxy-L-fuconate dehydrogenase
MKLANKIALVTGAASGIGAAIAALFAAEGAALALVDLNEDGLAAVAGRITPVAGPALTVTADVANAKAAAEGVARVAREFGRIDVLATCAGISVGGTVATIDEMLWDHVFAVNVKGTYLWAHEVLPHMIAQGSGSIVTVGSQLAVSSMGNNAAYIASKGAIVSLTKTMAVDHARDGIRVNAVIPGVIETAMPQLRRFGVDARTLGGAPPDESLRKAGGGRTRGALPGKRRFILHDWKPSLRRWRMDGDLNRSHRIFPRAKALSPTSSKG